MIAGSLSLDASKVLYAGYYKRFGRYKLFVAYTIGDSVISLLDTFKTELEAKEALRRIDYNSYHTDSEVLTGHSQGDYVDNDNERDDDIDVYAQKGLGFV